MAGISESRTWDAVLTTTLANYRKTLIDNIFDVYPLLSWLNGKLGMAMRGSTVKEVKTGGESIVEQILYEMNSTVDSYSGYGQLLTIPQEGMTIARFSWKQYAGAISMSGHERRVNKGEAAMIKLFESKAKQTEMSLRDRMSRDAYADGTGNGSLNLTGLAAIVSATTTVGGLSPTTFPWWKAYSATSVGSFATNGIDAIRTGVNTISRGNDAPDAMFTDQTNHERYESALQTKQQYAYVGTNKAVGDAGFQALAFRGIPMFFDRDCTANTLYMLNSRYLKFCVLKGADFDTSEFVTPENQDAGAAQILFEGNLVTNNRRNLGLLSGFSA